MIPLKHVQILFGRSIEDHFPESDWRSPIRVVFSQSTQQKIPDRWNEFPEIPHHFRKSIPNLEICHKVAILLLTLAGGYRQYFVSPLNPSPESRSLISILRDSRGIVEVSESFEWPRTARNIDESSCALLGTLPETNSKST